MAHLTQRRELACSYELACIFLERRLAPLADSGATTKILLQAPLPGIALAPSTEVEVKVGTSEHVPATGRAWSIHWSAEGHHSFPTFDGTLAIRRFRDVSVIELEGAYAPPFGALGRAFDAVLGSKIAAATAKALLNTFALEIELQNSARANKLAQTSQPRSELEV